MTGADEIPERQVRAQFTERTITVYQAYPPQIAEPALAAGTFVPPFKLDRMTWIKPSFLWMMYRSGWATKAGQERVLAVTVTRDGFEWALAHSCLSHYQPGIYTSEQQWADRKLVSPVRVQWDPERTLTLEPLHHRAIQIGLAEDAARRYLDEWIVGLTDVTDLAHQVRHLVTTNRLDEATDKLPGEWPYPLPSELQATIGTA
ncbi:MAG: DUF4291 domain-containing protein [Actinomycetota bacterium]|nr:DUF4291 domain-containing protein [Actinomycetota bacterium]